LRVRRGVGFRPFEHVFAEHAPLVLRVCRALLGAADAEDAAAEAFLSALRAYPALRAGSDVRGWLVTIAHRKAVDRLRANARAPRSLAALPEAGAPSRDAPETDPRLRAALEGLPFKQRSAVVHRWLAGMRYEEIGALLGSSAEAARRSAADGIANLRRSLRERAPA
jgi:RNA polymerase sigma factor (sigma-70 family)